MCPPYNTEIKEGNDTKSNIYSDRFVIFIDASLDIREKSILILRKNSRILEIIIE
jgi:hypothetical protein